MVKFVYKNLWGFADTGSMKAVIPPKYSGASDFSGGKALVLKEFGLQTPSMKFAWIDKKGKETPYSFSIPSKLKGGTPVYYTAGDKLYVISKNGVNLRESASLNGKVMMNVPHGSEVTVSESPSAKNAVSVGNIPGYWVKVVYNGKTGWLFDGFLSVLTPYSGSEKWIWNMVDRWKVSGIWKTHYDLGIYYLTHDDENKIPYGQLWQIDMTYYPGTRVSLAQLNVNYEGGVTVHYIFAGLRQFEVFQQIKTAGVIPDDTVYQGDEEIYTYSTGEYSSFEIKETEEGLVVLTTYSAD